MVFFRQFFSQHLGWKRPAAVLRSLGAVGAFLLCSCVVGAPASGHCPQQSPPSEVAKPAAPIALGVFAGAKRFPSDVAIFVHVDDASALRRNLASRPIAIWMHSLVGDGAVANAWHGLSRTAQISEATLFDFCFGDSVSFASRADGQWAIVATLGEDRASQLLRSLHVRAREPRFGRAITELPEQEIILASDGDEVIIGPSAQPQLFNEVVERMSAEAVASPLKTLASDDELLLRLGGLKSALREARIAVFMRHAPPMGGCSVIAADVRGDDLRFEHAAQFEHAPFLSPTTKLICDFSPVLAFSKNALVAIMQPRDVGDSPVEMFLNASAGSGLISADMRKNLADRRMLIVGEQDSRQLPEPSNILTTTFVACLELKDAEIAAPQLDRQMLRLTDKLNDLGEGECLIEMPETAGLPRCAMRHADLGDAEKLFTGGFPIMKRVSLNWAVAEGPNGNWFVIGTSPAALTDTIEALHEAPPRDGQFTGRFDNCGVANGVRLGGHLGSWSDEAGAFTDDANAPQVKATLKTLSEIASGLQDCRWQFARPTANTMRLEVQIKLAPAQSSSE